MGVCQGKGFDAINLNPAMICGGQVSASPGDATLQPKAALGGIISDAVLAAG
jgi:hypothetical protein